MPEVSATPGDPVRAYNVPGTSNNGQFFAMGAPKDIHTTTSRTSIASPDIPASGSMDPASISPIALKDAPYLWVGGNCSISSGSINFVVALYDSAGNVMCITDGYSLSAAPKYAVSGRYLATPARAIDVLGATSAAVIVTSVTGSWTLLSRPAH